MKSHYLVLAAAILSVPAMVFAEGVNSTLPQKTVNQWTCAEFVGIDDQFKPKAIYWASAHAKGGKKHKANVLNIEGTEKVIPIVIDECTKQPKATFWEKLKNAWQTVETSAKADAKEIKSNLGDIKTNVISNPE
jgi:acid stress chaperone HdeA